MKAYRFGIDDDMLLSQTNKQKQIWESFLFSLILTESDNQIFD